MTWKLTSPTNYTNVEFKSVTTSKGYSLTLSRQKRRECENLRIEKTNSFRFLLARFQLESVLSEIGQKNMRRALASLPRDQATAYEQVMISIGKAGRNTQNTVF